MQTIHNSNTKQICMKIANRGPNKLFIQTKRHNAFCIDKQLRYGNERPLTVWPSFYTKDNCSFPASTEVIAMINVYVQSVVVKDIHTAQYTMEWVVYPANDAMSAK